MTKLLSLMFLPVLFMGCNDDQTAQNSAEETQEEQIRAGNLQPVVAYADWDEDTDAQLNPDEFTTYFTEEDRYAGWDEDGNGTIEMEEWATFYNQYYPQYSNFDDGANFEEWDVNGDSRLDEEEFYTSTFSFWDSNEDGLIDEAEYMSHHYVAR